MANKSPKDERKGRSSRKRTTPAAQQENMPGTVADEFSGAQMEEILIHARQMVKPIIKREAENEIVGEDILNFRMVSI